MIGVQMFPGVVELVTLEEDGGSLRQGDDAKFAFQTRLRGT